MICKIQLTNSFMAQLTPIPPQNSLLKHLSKVLVPNKNTNQKTKGHV